MHCYFFYLAKEKQNSAVLISVSVFIDYILEQITKIVLKGNAQFVQKVTFEPLMDFLKKHYGS